MQRAMEEAERAKREHEEAQRARIQVRPFAAPTADLLSLPSPAQAFLKEEEERKAREAAEAKVRQPCLAKEHTGFIYLEARIISAVLPMSYSVLSS